MDTSTRRFIRLAIVSATAAGMALASPVVAVADDSEATEAAPVEEISDPPVVETPATEQLVIELVVEGDPVIATELPSDVQSEEPAGDSATTVATELPSDDLLEEPSEVEVARTTKDTEPSGAEPGPVATTLETDNGEEHSGEHSGGTGGETSGEHSGGTGGETSGEHSGGTGGEHSGGGGTGDPYQMTFVVSWRLPDDSAIPVFDDELPTDWRTMFDLAAASATGGGKPTSAHCTYPPGSTDLVCQFKNPGQHASVTDGMIVPAKPTATYSVTVLWPTSGWTIDGANAESYSARDLCPRGGHGEEGGHDSGHGETHEAAALEDSGFVCIHTVVIRRAPVTPDPPASDPPASDPPASEAPAAEPPQSQTPAPSAVEVLPAAVTPRTLPATGNTATTTLMIGMIILGLGGCLSVLARRRNDLPLG